MSYINGTRHWDFAYPKHTMLSHHCVRAFGNMLFELKRKNKLGELIKAQQIKTSSQKKPGDGRSCDQ